MRTRKCARKLCLSTAKHCCESRFKHPAPSHNCRVEFQSLSSSCAGNSGPWPRALLLLPLPFNPCHDHPLIPGLEFRTQVPNQYSLALQIHEQYPIGVPFKRYTRSLRIEDSHDVSSACISQTKIISDGTLGLVTGTAQFLPSSLM